jgi:hypothetical protein
MVPSFPKRPPKDCLLFIIQMGRRLNLHPISVHSSFISSYPNDYLIHALMISPSNPAPNCSTKNLSSLAIHSSLWNSLNRKFIHDLFEKDLTCLKSVMLESVYVNAELLIALDRPGLVEIHFNCCYFDPPRIFDTRDLQLGSVAKFHLKVENVFWPVPNICSVILKSS